MSALLRLVVISIAAFLCVGFTPNREQTERFLRILAESGFTIEDISTALDAEPTCRDISPPSCVISILNPSKHECSWSQRRCKVRSWDGRHWNDHVSPYPCSLSCTYHYRAGIPASPYGGTDCFFEIADPLPERLVPDLSFLLDECEVRDRMQHGACDMRDRGSTIKIGPAVAWCFQVGPDGSQNLRSSNRKGTSRMRENAAETGERRSVSFVSIRAADPRRV